MASIRHLLLLLAGALIWSCGNGQSETGASAPLRLEKTISLPGVRGRIDHLAYDPQARRLFVAELGNGTVEAIDLAAGKLAARIAGLHEPQGLAWLEATQELAVASGDGAVRFYRGERLEPAAQLDVGDDADNLRIDERTGALLVGYGAGALATIDPARHAVTSRLPLPAHPESFRLDIDRAYVNLPGAGLIAAVDRRTNAVTARWPTGLRRLNFPMALDAEAQRLAVAFRLPARLMLLDLPSGAERQIASTCGDSDDLFFDAARARLYVVCGSGAVDVFRERGEAYAREARVPSRRGARTGLFVPAEDRLFVAAPARDGHEAAILVFRPTAARAASRSAGRSRSS